MTTIIIPRKSWGAQRLGNDFGQMRDILGVTIHWNGPGMRNYTHGSCDDRLRNMQRYHIQGNGWNDIGYNFIVCRHGSIYEGRGDRAVGAHAGASNIGGNSRWYGIQAMIGTGDVITNELLEGLKKAVEYCRAKGGAGKKVNGHRSHHATDCPGDKLYTWVQRGMPINSEPKPPTPPKPKPPQEEEKMDYSHFANSPQSSKDVPSDEWVDVPFDTEHADPTGSHLDGGANPTILLGDREYNVAAFVALEGSNLAGTVVQMRAAEYKFVRATDTQPARDELVSEGQPVTTVLSSDGTAAMSDIGHCNDGLKLRIQVRHNNAGVLKMVGASARLFSQES